MCTQFIAEPQICPAVSTRSGWLMCSPEFYDVQYIINPWMAGNLHATSRARAIAQWRGLYEAISHLAHVELIDPEPGLPDMVFTANAGLEQNGIVVPSRFLHAERRNEETFFRSWFQQNGYRLVDLPQHLTFEGEGDALFSNDGSVLWVGYGMRTHRESHPFLAQTFNVKVISLRLMDSRFYHLDTCFAPLPNNYLLYYPPAFDRPSLGQIELFYPPHKRIPVSEDDACRFACNAIKIDDIVVLNEISRELKRLLESAGFRVLPLPLHEFLKAGGAAKCLVMELRFAAKAPAPASLRSSSSMDLFSTASSNPQS